MVTSARICRSARIWPIACFFLLPFAVFAQTQLRSWVAVVPPEPLPRQQFELQINVEIGGSDQVRVVEPTLPDELSFVKGPFVRRLGVMVAIDGDGVLEGNRVRPPNGPQTQISPQGRRFAIAGGAHLIRFILATLNLSLLYAQGPPGVV